MIKNVLNVPYYSQLDNKYEPYTACNVTSLAMCLSCFGVTSPSYIQLEDMLLQKAVNLGLNRFTPQGLKALAESYTTIGDRLMLNGNLQAIRDSIDNGYPVIIHGYFTSPGHIIVICGYTEEGFIVNDPYGEIMGLDHYNTNKSGERIHYSNGLIAAACDSWCYAMAKQRYPMGSREAESCNSMWIHRIDNFLESPLK